MTSLANDGNDQAKLRHGRAIHEGATVGCEFYQSCPFFFSREGAALSLIGLHRGAAAFLMAGGPSAGALDKTLLRRCWTITLNNAHTSYRGQANIIVDDPNRFNLSMWLDPTLQKFVPMSHFEKPLWDNRRMKVDREWCQRWEPAKMKVGDCPNVIGYRRNEKFFAPRWLYEDTINWGNHKKYGGGRSVMLATMRILFLLGFRRVYLLGVDFDMSPEKKYHFAEDRTRQAIKGNMETYAQLQGWFTELQPYFLEERFIVKNCNPKSRLTAFPFMPYEDAIAEATAHLGDYTQERTTGMYRKYEEKMAELNTREEPQLPTPAPAPDAAPDPVVPNVSSDTRLGGRFLEPLVAAVERAAVNKEPFCHASLDRIFQTAFYSELTAALPGDQHFHEGRHPNAAENDKNSRCRQIRLEVNEMKDLPAGQKEMWTEFSEALHSPHLEQAFRRVLDAGLADRFGAKRRSIRLQPTGFLLRECGGYRMTGYKANTPKIIVAQFHLPVDNSHIYSGSGYYRRKGGAFELAARIPFQPNAGSAFAVTEKSFHGTDGLSDASGARDSVVLSYYLRP